MTKDVDQKLTPQERMYITNHASELAIRSQEITKKREADEILIERIKQDGGIWLPCWLRPDHCIELAISHTVFVFTVCLSEDSPYVKVLVERPKYSDLRSGFGLIFGRFKEVFDWDHVAAIRFEMPDHTGHQFKRIVPIAIENLRKYAVLATF